MTEVCRKHDNGAAACAAGAAHDWRAPRHQSLAGGAFATHAAAWAAGRARGRHQKRAAGVQRTFL